MSILPFQRDDVVTWRGQLGVVVEVRGDRVVVVTDDGVLRITTQEALRAAQRAA
jgi:preprotein translocase subunit YajC